MDESREIKTMRYMAWERAKGELRSIYQTFWEEQDLNKETIKIIEDFIEKMESHSSIA